MPAFDTLPWLGVPTRQSPREPLVFTATAQRHTPKQSLHILVANNGTVYEPVNLPTEHNVNDTVLHVTTSEVTDRASIDQAEMLIHIDAIGLVSTGTTLLNDNEYQKY